MILRASLLLFAILAPPASADERELFYGTWGTPAQCARAPIKPGGTVLAEPFEIGEEWLRHGQIWCRLRWFPVEPRASGFFTGANAQCGEDAVRGYFLGMVLEDGDLTLRWDFPLSNGPLSRCDGD
ncbi:MAG: hypothetical protein AAF661_03225 [Pseudomonadota bacterium]